VSDNPPALTYVDTSAVVKLLFAEAESDALRAWLANTALSLGIRVTTLLTYDVRMIQAAEARSIPVSSPR